MSQGFPMEPLGKALHQRSNFIEINDLDYYKRCRVQWYGQGIVSRDTVLGLEIKTKKQQICRAGEFVVAEIDAKLGGFGIVPNDLDGAIVSSHYFIFIVNETILDRSYLKFFVRTPLFMEQVRAQGSTNYSAIRPRDALQYQIPLPPLEEQQRIVARIEEVAAKIEEARGLRQEAVEEAEILFNNELKSVFDRLVDQNSVQQLDNLIIAANYGTSIKCTPERLNKSTPVLRIPNVSLEQLNFDNMKYGHLSNVELQRVSLEKGDLLIVRTNGSIDLLGRCAVVRNLLEPTAFASYIIRLRCDNKVIDADYTQMVLKHLRISGKLIDFARTTAGQYNVSLGRLRTANIPVPPLDIQRQVVVYLNGLQAKVGMLKHHQAETSAELNALLPSILDKAFKGEL